MNARCSWGSNALWVRDEYQKKNEELSVTLAALKKPCVWTYDDVHDKWDTACGEAFQIECGGPSDNDMKFCCYCGHPISESHPIQEVTEDECYEADND